MTETISSSVPPEAVLTQAQRISCTFTAPSKTFGEIAGGRRSWWAPFLLMLVSTYILFAVLTVKIGWQQVAENSVHMNPKAEARMAQATEEQRAAGIKMTSYIVEGSFAASPFLVLLFSAVAAAILWGTINFVFGGKSTFSSVFSVWMYASLPGVIKTLLGTLTAFFTAPESFNLNNFAPTSIAAFLSPTETNAALYKLLTALDFTTIWSMVLLSIGLATVARVKRSSGYIAVFGWWILITLAGVGYAAMTA